MVVVVVRRYIVYLLGSPFCWISVWMVWYVCVRWFDDSNGYGICAYFVYGYEQSMCVYVRIYFAYEKKTVRRPCDAIYSFWVTFPFLVCFSFFFCVFLRPFLFIWCSRSIQPSRILWERRQWQSATITLATTTTAAADITPIALYVIRVFPYISEDIFAYLFFPVCFSRCSFNSQKKKKRKKFAIHSQCRPARLYSHHTIAYNINSVLNIFSYKTNAIFF